jgi:hypothetical protein
LVTIAGASSTPAGARAARHEESAMIYILLWLLGVPLSIILLLFLLGIGR